MVTVAETIAAQMLPLPGIEAMPLVRRLILLSQKVAGLPLETLVGTEIHEPA